MNKGILIGLIIFWFFQIAPAQKPTYYLDPNKNLNQYIIENWNSNNGLPTNSLLHLLQTSDGFLWVSGYGGLIRFDGIRFTVFNKKNTPEFESNAIRKLCEDKNSTLWMTTQGSGLVSYKNGVFHSYGPEQNLTQFHRALYIDNENRIWTATPEKGWCYFENGEFHFIHSSLPLQNIEVRAIVQDKAGSIWFGTLGKGLFRYKDEKLENFDQKDGLPNNWIYSLTVGDDNKLWIGTSHGLCTFNEGHFQSFPLDIATTVNSILIDPMNAIWLATTNGLYRKVNISAPFEHLSSENGLEHDFISDLQMDFEGNLWLANYKGGLTKIKDGKFINYTEQGGLSGKMVNAICQLTDASYLVGFDNGIINKIENGKISVFKTKSNLSEKRIRHILKDSKDNLWISTYSGLLKIDTKGNEKWFNQKNGLPESKIRLTFEDTKGNIWIGTRNSGLVIIQHDGSFRTINRDNGLKSLLIMSINEDNNNRILVGTSEGGLSVIKNDSIIKTYSKSDGFISDVIFNCYVDYKNEIWVAANGGLSLIRDTSVFNFTSETGLPDDSPFDIIDDGLGNFWLPCRRGIVKIRKANLLDVAEGKTQKIEYRLYNQHDGMQESECNAATQSLKAKDGSLLFPTIDGIAKISPTHIPVNNFIPPVFIENLTVNRDELDIHQPIIISPGKNRLTFTFTALSLYEPESIKFRYLLEGYEDEWSEPSAIRTVSYTNLPHGNYNFKVIACNNDGVWNLKGNSVQFSIKPNFYETIWFYLIFVIVLFTLILFAYRIRILSLKKQKEELEKLVSERTREITLKNTVLETQKEEIEQKSRALTLQKEEIQSQAEMLEEQKEKLKLLNQAKDKMFSIIAHDLRSPFSNFKSLLEIMVNHPDRFDNERKERSLANLLELANSTHDLLENLLTWAGNQQEVINFEPKKVQVSQIIGEIIRLIKPNLERKNIDIFNTIDPQCELYADSNMVKTIFRNLLNNAVKYTPHGGEVTIRMEHINEFIEFAIQDTGVGIPSDRIPKLFSLGEHFTTPGTDNEAGSGLGLMLCKDFVEKNNGKIWVESEPGKGSIFRFTLLSNAK